MKRVLTCAALIAATLGFNANVASAQTQPSQEEIDQAIAQLRKDARTEINALIGANMNFTSDEAAKFWPLYKTYEEQRKQLTDERIAIIKDYADNFTNMTDAKATELMNRGLALEAKSEAAKSAFMAELLKVLPGKTVARFYQVHNRIDTLVDLMLAAEIPIVQ
jgi:hypothetical protein